MLFMVSYRTSMQIMEDLLTATKESGQEGIKTTALISKANLSHSRLSKLLSNLIGTGLVNKIEFDGKHTFVITQKGRQYLESYQKFSTIAESFGLEL
jgi:predicted transcriptional regulator